MHKYIDQTPSKLAHVSIYPSINTHKAKPAPSPPPPLYASWNKDWESDELFALPQPAASEHSQACI